MEKKMLKDSFWIILVVLIALFAMYYTAASAKSYQQECNIHWQNEMRKCDCSCMPGYIVPIFDKNFSYKLPLEGNNEYTSKD